MITTQQNSIAEIFSQHEKTLLEDWLREQLAAFSARQDLIYEADLRRESAEFLARFTPTCQTGSLTDIFAPEWASVLHLLATLSRSRALQGFSPTETAPFIFSLKQPLFARLRQVLSTNTEKLADELWAATAVLTPLKSSRRAAKKSLNASKPKYLSCPPVLKLWEGVIALPLIGTLDDRSDSKRRWPSLLPNQRGSRSGFNQTG
jgi:rsbT co-antagonist protein RsbR